MVDEQAEPTTGIEVLRGILTDPICHLFFAHYFLAVSANSFFRLTLWLLKLRFNAKLATADKFVKKPGDDQYHQQT